MDTNTDVGIVLDCFKEKMEATVEFFDFFNTDDATAEALITERSMSLLYEACSFLRRLVELDFTLAIATVNDVPVFTEGITVDEADLLADIMAYLYGERQKRTLMPKINTFQASELKSLHSPANERSSFLAMIKAMRKGIDGAVRAYKGKDRLTGARKRPQYTLSQDE